MTGYFPPPRAIVPGDAEPARALVLGALGVTPYVDRVLELLGEAEDGDAETQALVMERDGTMAALALFGTVSGALSCWRLSTLLMAPRLEPRDVGRAMIDAIVARVQALGGRLLMAELPADAAFGRTLSLLRSTGFREEGRVRDFYRDGVSLLFLRREM